MNHLIGIGFVIVVDHLTLDHFELSIFLDNDAVENFRHRYGFHIVLARQTKPIFVGLEEHLLCHGGSRLET